MAITYINVIRENLKYTVSYAANEKKTSLDNVIEYAVNEDKTEQRLFQSALNCASVETAYIEMQEAKERWQKEGDVLGYHFIQSFKEDGDEMTPELAHKIGVEFARQCFGDRFQAVIGTHLDTEHLHNHIVVNSVSYMDGGKYHSSPRSYYEIIRAVSDKLCRENELNVIENPKGHRMHYAEWKALKEGKPTMRGLLKTEIDEIIKSSYTMQDFWKILKERGYVIKRPQGKYKHPSVLAPYAKYPMRFDKLGAGYSLEDIQQRIIAARHGIRTAASSELPKRKVYKFKGDLRNVKPKKLKGFIALYFHYLYLFGKIRKKQTPQKVSFFMREELLKLDRYQKQFKFLNNNKIETVEQLTAYQTQKTDEIEQLTLQRKQLYKERTDENCEEIKTQISQINSALRAKRSEVRLCKSIYDDAQHIAEKQRQAQELAQPSEKEVNRYEHKRRSR